MHTVLVVLFGLVQVPFLVALLITIWFLTLKVNLVPLGQNPGRVRPTIVMFYPVLREPEETMRTTFIGFTRATYPRHLLRVIAIPNDNDAPTIAALQRLQAEFDFLEILPVPPTTDPSWDVVWSAWRANPKAYWWHTGRRAGNTALPPKKTRQLIWAMHQLAPKVPPGSLLSYIDADSATPPDYFELAATGIQQYDVVQCTNIAGNALATRATPYYAMDHILWDGTLYKHMTADGKHPYYVLGKGLFYRFSDLLEVGGFNPWITIEDPEIGMRLWTNGRRLGVAESPLIEEVPATFMRGITQRKRWVAGFFQSLASPLTQMGMPYWSRMRARLNFVPCLSLLVNAIGWPLAVWAVILAVTSDTQFIPEPFIWLSVTTVSLDMAVVSYGLVRAWKLIHPVLPRTRDRIRFLVRVNPLFLHAYWLWWSIPLLIGFWMFLRDGGLAWERTEKTDALHSVVRRRVGWRERHRHATTGVAGAHGQPSYDTVNADRQVPDVNVSVLRGPEK